MGGLCLKCLVQKEKNIAKIADARQVNINGKLMMRTMIRSFFQVARNLQARQLLEKPTIFSDTADENVH